MQAAEGLRRRTDYAEIELTGFQKLPTQELVHVLELLDESDLKAFTDALGKRKPIELRGHHWAVKTPRYQPGTDHLLHTYVTGINAKFDQLFSRVPVWANRLKRSMWSQVTIELNGFAAKIPLDLGVSETEGFTELPNGQFAIMGTVIGIQSSVAILSTNGQLTQIYPLIQPHPLHVSMNKTKVVIREGDGSGYIWGSGDRPDYFKWSRSKLRMTTILGLEKGRFAVGYRDGTISVWDKKGNPLKTHHSHMTPLILSERLPNGNFVMASSKGSVSVNRSDGSLVAIQDQHYADITCLKVSPDIEDIHFVTGDDAGLAIVWDRNCVRRYTLSLAPNSEPILRIAFLCRNVIVTSSKSIQCFWSNDHLVKSFLNYGIMVNLSGSRIAQYGPKGVVISDNELTEITALPGKVARVFSLTNGNLLTIEIDQADKQVVKLWSQHNNSAKA